MGNSIGNSTSKFSAVKKFTRALTGVLARSLTLALVLAIFLTISPLPFPCGVAGISWARASAEGTLYVAIIWHNHQPLYKNPEENTYELPWVRLHATKDYYDMATILKDYPGIHVTFNMVPSLLAQLQDYAQGATDKYLLLSEKPSSQLTAEDKDFILRRFFDANWDRVIPAFPRYQELLELRGRDVTDDSITDAARKFSEDDFRDLQVLFNLAWFDPEIREKDKELSALVKKGRSYSEEDKKVVLDKQKEIISEIIPLYSELQDSGAIEIATCPFYHPILPLLYDNASAQECSPDLKLPDTPWQDPAEMERQIRLGIDFTEKTFGKKPSGMWPPEMAVSQKILPTLVQTGVSWIVADEGVLAKSLSQTINRTPEGQVKNPDVLYSAYRLSPDSSSPASGNEKPLYILFRDRELSDAIGFKYSGMKGADAAEDLYARLKSIQKSLNESGASSSSQSGGNRPHIVTIALDGENCWEYYENDGKEFLRSFYEKLQSDTTLKAVTVSEFLQEFPPEKTIDNLATGSWIDASLDTWIGEPDENLAWSALTRARDALNTCIKSRGARTDDSFSDRITKAQDALMAAEGSDWFWWYGNDQTSANDEAFDALFRSQLKAVYRFIGETPPSDLDQPIAAPSPQNVIPEDLNLGEKIFEINDPSSDDNGPGTYTYPLDPIFKPGDFDLKKVEVYRDPDWLSFKVFLGHISNGWNSPLGLSVQTIDIYLRSTSGSATADQGSTASGPQPSKSSLEKRAIPGRYVTFQPGHEWNYAVWVEGWIQKTFGPDFQEIPEGKPKVMVDESEAAVLIRVPVSVVGIPEKFNVLVMGQEGYPPEGNWRVRDVTEKSSQWRFGGGSNQVGEPNIIDMLVPPGMSQAKLLRNYNIPERKLASIYLLDMHEKTSGGGVWLFSPYMLAGWALLILVTAWILWALRRRSKASKLQ